MTKQPTSNEKRVGLLFKSIRERLDYILLFVASVVFVSLWFHANIVLMGGDFMLPLNPSSIFLRELSYWNHWLGAGSSVPPLLAGSPPLIDSFFFSALSLVGLSLSISQRIYLTISVFVGSLSIYSLIRSLPTDAKNLRTAGLFGASFYLLSPWPLNSGFPSLPLYFHFATMAFLASLAIFAIGLRKAQLSYGLLLGPSSLIAFQVLTAVPLFMTLGGMIAVGLIAAYLWREYRKVSFHAKSLFICKYLVICILSIAATSMYWFFIIWNRWPTLQAAFVLRPASADLAMPGTTTFLNGMRLLGNWAFYSGIYVPYSAVYLDSWALMGLTLFPAIIGFVSLLLYPKDKSVIVLNAVTITTLLLSSAGDGVVGLISNSLTSSSWFFRFEAGGFPFYLALLVEYAILFGVSSSRISHFLDGRVHQRTIVRSGWRVISVCLILSIVVINSWPYFTGAVLENWYHPSSIGVSVPSQYAAANSWLDGNGGDFRVMMVPQLGNYVANSWGYQGTSSFYPAMFNSPLITGSSLSYFSTSNDLIKYAYGFMKLGMPLNLTAEAVSTNTTSDWTFGASEIAAVDALSIQRSSNWDTGSALRWDISFNQTTPNGHQIIWIFPKDQDWSSYSGISLQVAGSLSSEFLVGLGTPDGTVGWLRPDASFVSNATGDVRTIVLKISEANPRLDPSRIRTLILRYDVNAVSSGRARVLVSDIRLASPTYGLNAFDKLLSVLNVKYTLFDTSLDSKLYPELNPDPYLKFYTQNRVTPSFSQGSVLIFTNNETTEPLFSASKIISLGSVAEMGPILSTQQFDPRTSSFIVGSTTIALQKSITDPNFGMVQATIVKAGSDYHVKAVSTGPFVLVLAETFDDGWVASEGNQVLTEHFIANGYSNGWLLAKSGTYDITISYISNNLYRTTLAASFATGLTLACTFFLCSRVRRRVSDPRSGPGNYESPISVVGT